MPVYAITIDGAPSSFLVMDIDRKITAYDILSFINAVTEKLLAEKAVLEASSRAMGKTNAHGIGGVGSVSLKNPDLSDEIFDTDPFCLPSGIDDVGSS